MGKLKDLTGMQFGRLKVLERAENGASGRTRWLCQCDCKNKTIVEGHNLVSGYTRSCGCLEKEVNIRKDIRDGRFTRLHNIWRGMKARCYNSHNKDYVYYGGRGITICDEWRHDFQKFYDWALSHGYDDTLSIDRIDVNGNYDPSNCRWTTAKEQAQNRRPPRKRKE